MAKISTADFRSGVKVEVDGQPYEIIENEFVKPGKGQAFNRVRLKHLTTKRVIERTFKSGDSLDVADVLETSMRMLYTDTDGAVFMDDDSYEQITISNQVIEDVKDWLMEDILYAIVFYKGEAVGITPPTFLELKITQTDPGIRGNTASGRVLKPAIAETGAKIQIPIFVEEGETIKIDTRTGEYVSRVSK